MPNVRVKTLPQPKKGCRFAVGCFYCVLGEENTLSLGPGESYEDNQFERSRFEFQQEDLLTSSPQTETKRHGLYCRLFKRVQGICRGVAGEENAAGPSVRTQPSGDPTVSSSHYTATTEDSIDVIFSKKRIASVSKEPPKPSWDIQAAKHMIEEELDKSMENLHFRRAMTAIANRPVVMGVENIKYITDRANNYISLGSGAYGTVVLGAVSNQLVAIKLHAKEKTSLAEVLREAAILQLVQLTGATPRFLGFITLQDSTEYQPLGLVTSFIGNDRATHYTSINLEEMIDIEKCRLLSELPLKLGASTWVSILADIAKKLQHLHELGIVVCDIKPDNFVLQEDLGIWEPFFVDLGTARYGDYNFPIKKNEDLKVWRKKYPHVAPEAIQTRMVTAKYDIFSMGYVMNEIRRTLGVPLKDWILKCCETDASLRPTAKELSSALTAYAEKLRTEEEREFWEGLDRT